MSAEPCGFFVYGTLKRGEQRARLWPHVPREIRVATLQAALFDLGPYPAIARGAGSVAGELWLIGPEHMADTIERLDWIEGFNQSSGAKNIYVREVVDCQDARGETQRAYTYFYADAALLANIATRVPPDADGHARWSGGARS